MKDTALPYNPTELEVLDLVDHLSASMRAQERAGFHHPDNAGRINELERIADVIHKRVRHRREQLEAEALEDGTDKGGPINMPRNFEDKLKLLKRLEIVLTTVQPDGSTMAEKAADRKGLSAALRESAALYKKLKAELDKQRKLEQLAEEALAGVRDMLLLWKLNLTNHLGPAGQA